MHISNDFHMQVTSTEEHFMGFRVQVDNAFSSQQSNVCVTCIYIYIARQPTKYLPLFISVTLFVSMTLICLAATLNTKPKTGPSIYFVYITVCWMYINKKCNT